MKNEKSCGAVVYNIYNGEILFLIIQHKNGGHWGIPKGHVENGETEGETALREIKEETGLYVILDQSFRYSMEYSPKTDVIKEVVYFVASTQQREINMQQSEILDYKWLDIAAAKELLSHQNSRELLKAAYNYIVYKESTSV